MARSVSTLMKAADAGDRAAADTLFNTLYSELHRLARRELARAGGSPAFGVTTLVHEAYLDFSSKDASFPDRARFMGYAARVMRGLIIDQVRARRAWRRGGQFEIMPLSTDIADVGAEVRRLTTISDALDELAQVDAALAEIVDLKFFCGFSFGEIAAMRRTSERTVQRNWEKARLYLHRSMSGQPLE